jgi:hypothetical protein
MTYSVVFLVFLIAICNPGHTHAQAGFRMSPMEWNFDRPGSDYKVFDLQAPDPTFCQDACFRDPRCMAWTYMQPNPGRSPGPNRVSGYKLR